MSDGIFVSNDAFLAYLGDVARCLGTGWSVQPQHNHGHYLVGPYQRRIFVLDLQMQNGRVSDRGFLKASISYHHIPGADSVYPSPQRGSLRFTATRGPLNFAKAIASKLLALADAEVARITGDRKADEAALAKRQEIVDEVRRIGMVTGRVTRVVNSVESGRAIVDLRSQNDTDAPTADVEINYGGSTMALKLNGPTDKVLAALRVLYANGVDADELYGAHLN